MSVTTILALYLLSVNDAFAVVVFVHASGDVFVLNFQRLLLKERPMLWKLGLKMLRAPWLSKATENVCVMSFKMFPTF